MSEMKKEVRLLSLHWGFSLGGVAQYAAVLENVVELVPIKISSICILSEKWQTDRKTLKKLNPKEIMIRGRLDLSWLWRLAVEIEKLNPDMVMTHGFNTHFAFRIAEKITRRRIPLICSYHGHYNPPTFMKKSLKKIFDFIAENTFRNRAMAVVAVAEYCASYLRSKGVSSDKIEVIHNGIPDINFNIHETRQKSRRLFNVSDDIIVIGVASRLDPVKGLRYLIEALPAFSKNSRNIHAVIIGEGTEAEYLKKLCVKMNLKDKVSFLGFRDDIAECMMGFDIFVLPSLAEYHSIGILEAMRAGLPMVVTDVGGNTESVRHEMEALVVPPADSAKLQEALNRLVRNKPLREQLGNAARRRFLSKFTSEVMIRKTANWLVKCKEKVCI
jgi:glycosyltransferase involved in cell wall biosynthesis